MWRSGSPTQAPMVDPDNPLDGLTGRQRQALQNLLSDMRSSLAWSWQLPVLIRQRCWLRLEMIPLGDLHRWLPPDGREDAPELALPRTGGAGMVTTAGSGAVLAGIWRRCMPHCTATVLGQSTGATTRLDHAALSRVDQSLQAIDRIRNHHHSDAGAAPGRSSDRSSAALGFGQHTADAAHLRLIPGHGP